MRDILFTLLVLGILPTCYRRPFIGLLTFSWLAYMRGQDLTWGFARYQRWSFLVAIVTLLGYHASKPERWFRPCFRTTLMMAMVAWITISTYVANELNPWQPPKFVEYCKIIGVALFTTAVVNRPERLRVIVWVIALSFGFYGVKNGLRGAIGGGGEILRGPGGMLADNNDFGLALVMSVPMLLHLGTTEANKILRRGVLLMVPLTVFTIVLTFSRGAFLALAGTFMVLVWRSRNRVAGIAIGILAVLAAAIAAPPEYYDRLDKIRNYQEDGSARGRLAAWGTALRMSDDNPFFGVGINNFPYRYDEYAGPGEHARVAHNSYLQMLAEAGAPTLGMYLLLILATLWCLARVRRLAKRHYFTSWIVNYATMFEASLVGFIIGSTFLNRAHFDLLYHWVALAIAFEFLAREEMARPMHHPVRTVEGSWGPVRTVPQRGFRRVKRRRGFRNVPLHGT